MQTTKTYVQVAGHLYYYLKKLKKGEEVKKKFWSPEEIEKYENALNIYGYYDREKIAMYVGTKNRLQIKQR